MKLLYWLFVRLCVPVYVECVSFGCTDLLLQDIKSLVDILNPAILEFLQRVSPFAGETLSLGAVKGRSSHSQGLAGRRDGGMDGWIFC